MCLLAFLLWHISLAPKKSATSIKTKGYMSRLSVFDMGKRGIVFIGLPTCGGLSRLLMFFGNVCCISKLLKDMSKRHLRIHGDNIIECERTLAILSNSFGVEAVLNSSSYAFLPTYSLGNFEIDLLAGHGRWGIDLAQILAEHCGVLREGADSYVTEVIGNQEQILLAIEYCSALPAGNNAWQRSGRALSAALAGVPYFYFAEIGGVELDDKRNVKAPRFPNPIVPFSYLLLSKRLGSFCVPIYLPHPSITEALYQKYINVFGYDECIKVVKAIINHESFDDAQNVLIQRALEMVAILSNDRKNADTPKGADWLSLYNSNSATQWLFANTNITWKKKMSDKVLTSPSFPALFKKVMSLNCHTIGAKDIPICLIPTSKLAKFKRYLEVLYPTVDFNFNLDKPLSLVWITGFKPKGDDSRPDRGLSPLAKMVLGSEAQLMAIVYGPAKIYTWSMFKKSPKQLASNNGLWQSIINLCDYVFIDSINCEEKIYYTTDANLSQNTETINFDYVTPQVDYSEHDTDTAIHQLFSRKTEYDIFEALCNPPGGDWSGISYYKNVSDEYRWTSLPRVSAIGGKRPDHIIQVRKKDKMYFLSIESKLYGRDLEENIGINLKTYIEDLFQSVPTAHRSSNCDWRLYEGSALSFEPYEILSVGAFAFISLSDMELQLRRGNLDAVFAFEFGTDTTLHVLTAQSQSVIVDLLKKSWLQLPRIKIQIH